MIKKKKIAITIVSATLLSGITTATYAESVDGNSINSINKTPYNLEINDPNDTSILSQEQMFSANY